MAWLETVALGFPSQRVTSGGLHFGAFGAKRAESDCAHQSLVVTNTEVRQDAPYHLYRECGYRQAPERDFRIDDVD